MTVAAAPAVPSACPTMSCHGRLMTASARISRLLMRIMSAPAALAAACT